MALEEYINKVVCGDNYEVLKKFPDNSVDAVVTDPPYGLNKDPDAAQMLKEWIEKGYMEAKGSGFMNKVWDSQTPQPIFWKEVIRVLKPGGHVLSFFGTRTFDMGVLAMRLAGFEIRDQLIFCFGGGFPKALDISKAIDSKAGVEREVIGQNEDILKKQAKDIRVGKRKIKESFDNGASDRNNGFKTVSADITEPNTNEAKQWDGWKTGLKPALEPIVLARKPIEKGLTIADNVLKWGTGALNIDGTRIKHNDAVSITNRKPKDGEVFNGDSCGYDNTQNNIASADPKGRFPSNLILSHHHECVYNGVKKVKCGKNIEEKGTGGIWNESSGLPCGDQYGDENGEESMEDWTCHNKCPINIMNEQSGVRKSGSMKSHHDVGKAGDGTYLSNQVYGKYKSRPYPKEVDANEGFASRFFYSPKASRSERNFGLNNLDNEKEVGHNRFDKCETCEGYIFQNPDRPSACKCENPIRADNKVKGNFHPTVKNIKLMQYLVRLITPPNGIALDPYSGSGSTGIACVLEGIKYICIEQDPEYCKIAEARIKAWNEVDEYEDYKKIIEAEQEEESEPDNQLSLFE